MEGSISRRYGTAFVNAALEHGDAEVESGAKELEQLAALAAESSDLRHVFASPTFTGSEREKALAALLQRMQVSPLVQRFVLLLAKRNRLAQIPAIARTVRRLADQRAGRLHADVFVAAPLSKDAADSLRRAMERRTGKNIEMEVKVDPTLLGGVRAEIGGQVFDGTLRAQLDQLRENLLRAE
ncbi:MAG: ATP synthase F1 subunit delta [Deltaproteobacteria bacterium]|nr:ATP synthase F1 subunit delta [Deltaproteobacteria bacterium]